MLKFFNIFLVASLVIFSFNFANGQTSNNVIPKKGSPKQWIYGLTIENLDDDEFKVADFINKFSRVSVPITLRIVFQRKTLPSDYLPKLKQLHDYTEDGIRKFYIMAMLFDSEALKEYQLDKKPESKFDCKKFRGNNMDYYKRAKCFVSELESNHLVDAWEVGNEVNGEWADEKHKDSLSEDFVGNFQKTIDKINTIIDLVPNNKPLALTVSYMPGCGEWKDNALDKWIKHFKQPMIDKIDYVLISYYEDKCYVNGDENNDYTFLTDNDINTKVIKPLKCVFKDQFIGFGEIGYSEGKEAASKDCPDKNCYCPVKGNASKISKTLQMQRYYSFKADDPSYIGGGFWWNAGKDYSNTPGFLDALKQEFICLSTQQQCPKPPDIVCPLPK